MVVEIPAGTNKKTEINKQNGAFEISLRDGKARMIDFLAYPINYGFVPSTLMNKKSGGDGDPIDVLLICESLPVGKVIEFIPIAVLYLKDSGELDSKIISIPKHSKQRTITSENFDELKSKYPAIMKILELWFSFFPNQI